MNRYRNTRRDESILKQTDRHRRDDQETRVFDTLIPDGDRLSKTRFFIASHEEDNLFLWGWVLTLQI